MYYHLVKFPIVYSLSLVIWPLAALPKLNINFTGCAIDNFAAACYNGITRKGKEGKHDVCKDELEGSKGKVQ